MEIRGAPRMSRDAVDTGFSSAEACERAIRVEQVRLVYQRIRATQWAMLVLAIAIAWVFRAVGIACGSVTAYAPLLPVFTAYVAVLTLILDVMLIFGRL